MCYSEYRIAPSGKSLPLPRPAGKSIATPLKTYQTNDTFRTDCGTETLTRLSYCRESVRTRPLFLAETP